MTNVPLPSGGGTIPVRRLGLFELDYIERDIPGPYTVTVLFASGEVYEQEFDMSRGRPAPDKPLEEVEGNTGDWYAWREHLRYQEAELHYKRQREAYSAYLDRIAAYILVNCIEPGDRNKITTAEDYAAIYQAALCPQVSFEDIRTVTRNVYAATFEQVDVFDALDEIESGGGAYDWLRQAEGELQIELGDTEENYIKRSVRERARLIMAMKLPGIVQAIYSDRAGREHRKLQTQETEAGSDDA